MGHVSEGLEEQANEMSQRLVLFCTDVFEQATTRTLERHPVRKLHTAAERCGVGAGVRMIQRPFGKLHHTH